MTDRLTTLLHDVSDRLDVGMAGPEQLRRAGQRKRGVRRGATAALAAATTVAIVVPLTLTETRNNQAHRGVTRPSGPYPAQFALPAVGPVSLPAKATLVLNINPRAGGNWQVYADGRIIWQRWSRTGRPLVIPQGTDALHTAYVQQRLTPSGVQLLISRIMAIGRPVGLFRHNVGLVDPTDGLQPDWYQVCNNGHLNNVQVTNPETSNDPIETPAQKRALAEIDALMTHSTSLLPASAWVDPTIRPYVPSRYGLGWTDFAVPDPSKLPSPAREALAKVMTTDNGRPVLTPDEARALLEAFGQSRIKVVSNRADSVAFQVPATGRSDSTRLSIAPDWPISPLWDANRC